MAFKNPVTYIMCNTHDIQVICGPFYSNSYGPCKNSEEIPHMNIFKQLVKFYSSLI